MPEVIGIIQARMDSERLPGKILAPLAGRTLIEWVAHRVSSARSVQEWWLATTDQPEDDVTTLWGHELGLRVYRGAAGDVLSRYTAIIRERSPGWVVRVTANCPFTDGAVIDALVAARETARDDCDVLQTGYEPEGDLEIAAAGPPKQVPRPLPGSDVTGLVIEEIPGTGHPLAAFGRETQKPPTLPVRPPGLPLGYGAQLARAAALLASEAEIPESEPWHRTHVLSWLEARGRASRVPPPTGWPDRPEWRWTVDTEEDLLMTRTAFRLFGLQAGSIGYPEMVRLLDAHPEITALNQHVVAKPLEQGR